MPHRLFLTTMPLIFLLHTVLCWTAQSRQGGRTIQVKEWHPRFCQTVVKDDFTFVSVSWKGRAQYPIQLTSFCSSRTSRSLSVVFCTTLASNVFKPSFHLLRALPIFLKQKIFVQLSAIKDQCILVTNGLFRKIISFFWRVKWNEDAVKPLKCCNATIHGQCPFPILATSQWFIFSCIFELYYSICSCKVMTCKICWK